MPATHQSLSLTQLPGPKMLNLIVRMFKLVRSHSTELTLLKDATAGDGTKVFS